jgi:hypothetical protein
MTHDCQAQAIARYSFLRVFANDRTIDPGELDLMVRLAMRDHVVDAAERETLNRIFSRVSPETADPDVWRDIQLFRRKHGLDTGV